MELHPDLVRVGALLGTWTGRGHGEYPTIESFDYVETVTFGHVGKPFLAYGQRTRRLFDGDEPGPPLHAETGYWRFPTEDRVEVVLSHPFGIVEVDVGSIVVDGATVRIELTSSELAATPTAKSVTQVERTFKIDGDALEYSVRMAAVGQPLQHHLAARLTRSEPG